MSDSISPVSVSFIVEPQADTKKGPGGITARAAHYNYLKLALLAHLADHRNKCKNFLMKYQIGSQMGQKEYSAMAASIQDDIDCYVAAGDGRTAVYQLLEVFAETSDHRPTDDTITNLIKHAQHQFRLVCC